VEVREGLGVDERQRLHLQVSGYFTNSTVGGGLGGGGP
jgi:hypothetical protein